MMLFFIIFMFVVFGNFFQKCKCDFCANIYLIGAMFGPADVTERMMYYLDGRCLSLKINVDLSPSAAELQDLFLATDPFTEYGKTFALIYRKVAEKKICASAIKESIDNFTPESYELSTCYPESTNPLLYAVYASSDITKPLRAKMNGDVLPITNINNESMEIDPYSGVVKTFIAAFKNPDGSYAIKIGWENENISFP